MDETVTVTVQEAARVLGLSPAAVRKRISRGTVRATKVDKEWMVALPRDAVQEQDSTATVTQPGRDVERDTSYPLVEVLRAQVAQLSGQVEALTAALARRDELMTQAREAQREEIRAITEAMTEEARRRDSMIAALGQLAERIPLPPALPAPTGNGADQAEASLDVKTTPRRRFRLWPFGRS